MSTKYKALAVVNFLLVISLAGYIFYNSNKSKTAFIYSQKVFQEYKGTKDLTRKLAQYEARDKSILDSISTLIKNGKTDLQVMYEAKARDLSDTQHRLSEQYTADIWRHINEEISNYGKENNYEYILGASGNGSLMYASELNDITDKVINHLNLKYEGN